MKKERKHKTASIRHERKYYSFGYQHIFGIDEAGRGPWAGPVSAAAVCLPVENPELPRLLRGVRDSKQMTALQRASLVATIKEVSLAWGIGSADATEIDTLGILPATMLAMERALQAAVGQFSIQPDCLLLDDMLLPTMRQLHQVSMIEGDSRSLSIAAASVLAKTWRDELMLELDAEFPQYGFARHKGYGTADHLAALKQFGPSPMHRKSFRPILELSQMRGDDLA